jgi:tetratricopeptide (TPR) repeat protein
LILVWPEVHGRAAPAPTTHPVSTAKATTTANVDQPIRDAIGRLGSDDPAAREEATRFLWASGSAAAAALRQAAASGDPEVASRAATVLRNIEYGLLPDTPAEILDLLDLYLSRNHAQRVMAVNRLASLGPRGLRVLLALRDHERDPDDRQLILAVLTPHAHEAAAALIASGEMGSAESLLRAAAPMGQAAARDAAAFELVRGRLAQRVAQTKAVLEAKPDVETARELLYLARANGDLATARWAADQSADPHLVDSILMEQADWPELARRYAARPGDSDSIEVLSLATTFARLANDADMERRSIDAVKDHARRHPDEYWQCAQALFQNDRPTDGIELLVHHKDYARATELLTARLEYPRVIELVKQAAAEHNPDRWRLRLRLAVALRYMGRLSEARRIVADVTADPHALVAEQWAALIDAEREMGDDLPAEHHRMVGLSIVQPDSAGPILEQAGFADDFPAALWWELLRRRRGNESVEQTWHELQDFASGKLPLEQMQAMAELALADARRNFRTGQARQDPRLRSAADALFAAKHYKQAMTYFQNLAELLPGPDEWVRIGDCQAAMGDWRGSATTYQQAWEMDPSRPVPLALRAWALAKAGDAPAEASRLLELAHLLPLAGDEARFELARVLSTHGMDAEAQREEDLVLRTAPLVSWSASRVAARRADRLLHDRAYLPAAAMLERTFLQNIRLDVTFVNAYANLAIPSLIHSARTLGLLRAGDRDGALREARLCRADTPGNADRLIEITNALRDAGATAQADQFFEETSTAYEKLCSDVPDSGPAYNLAAWYEGKCARKLDDALRHAQRAVALEPDNTASLDTMAEVRFARGEFQQAIDAIQRCIDLEPQDESHRAQLLRFQAAAKH